MSANDVLRKQNTSTVAVVNNILAYWDRATDTNKEDGAQWYLLAGQAIDDMAAAYKLDRETVAAVVAHLSPRTPWARNLAGAASLLAGAPIPGLLGRNLAGARAALDSDNPMATLKGRKTSAFARNLSGDSEAVTIDVWALRVALGDRDDADLVLNRVGVYDALAHCYRLAAARRGVTPSTMQATTWIVARNGRAN